MKHELLFGQNHTPFLFGKRVEKNNAKPATPWYIKVFEFSVIILYGHTSATILLSSGADIKTVASRLGHTQLSTTNRYVHALRDADEAAAQTFENLINSPPEKEQNAQQA